MEIKPQIKKPKERFQPFRDAVLSAMSALEVDGSFAICPTTFHYTANILSAVHKGDATRRYKLKTYTSFNDDGSTAKTVRVLRVK